MAVQGLCMMRKWSRVAPRKYSFLLRFSLKIFKWHACTTRGSKRKSLSATKRIDPTGKKKTNFDKMQSFRAQTGVRRGGRTLPRRNRQCAACSFCADCLKEGQPQSTSKKIKPTSGYHHVWCGVFQVLCVTVRPCNLQASFVQLLATATVFGGFPVLLQQLLTEGGVYILSHIQVRWQSVNTEKGLASYRSYCKKMGKRFIYVTVVVQEERNATCYWNLCEIEAGNSILVGFISFKVLGNLYFELEKFAGYELLWVLCPGSPHASQQLDWCMQCTVPLRIQRPLLPSWVMAPPLFSLLWESERLSLLSSEPSSESSFATSEMSFYVNKTVRRIH